MKTSAHKWRQKYPEKAVKHLERWFNKQINPEKKEEVRKILEKYKRLSEEKKEEKRWKRVSGSL
jgi:hypothetical protein